MNGKQRLLLACDSIINLLLGLLLLLFPAGLVDLLGLPPTNTFFYPTILGGVIIGIGIALGIELLTYPKMSGLGLAGAIAINFSGGLVLIYWLLFAKMEIPLNGTVILWIIAVLVLGIGIIELATQSWRGF